MKDIVRAARSKIIQHRIDMISLKELSSWADSVILDMSQPPNYILDLSMEHIPVLPEYLDTVRNPICSDDCGDIVSKLRELIEEKNFDGNLVHNICYRLAGVTDGVLADKFSWISDELYLCNEGVKYLSESLPDIKGVLDEITSKIA